MPEHDRRATEAQHPRRGERGARSALVGKRAAAESIGARAAGGPRAARLLDAAWSRLDQIAQGEMEELRAAAGHADAGAAERGWRAVQVALLEVESDLKDAEARSPRASADEASAITAGVAAARSVCSVFEADALDLVGDAATTRPADLSTSEVAIAFSATEVGFESSARTVSITNQGARPVAIDQVCAPGKAQREFPTRGQSRAPLLPGESEAIEVAFLPSDVGPRRSRLHVLTDDGISSATIEVEGAGIPLTEASRDRARVATLAGEVGGGAAIAAPRTFAAMRDLLQAARALEEDGDRVRARSAVGAVGHSLAEVASPARRDAVFARFGLARTSAEQMLGSALFSVQVLDGKLGLGSTIEWSYHLGAFDVGRESIELLTGEREDSTSLRAGNTGGKGVLLGAGGIMGALAAAPVLASEGGLALHGLRSAGLGAALWGARNPELAVELAGLAAGQAIQTVEAGGLEEWWDQVTSGEGAIDLAFGLLQAYETGLAARPGRSAGTNDEVPADTVVARPRAAPDGRQSSGTGGPTEADFKAMAIDLERRDGGHSIDRHGPEISSEALEARLRTGVAPDGVVSPTVASTRFARYEDWATTREAAWKAIEELNGIDLQQPRGPNQQESYRIIVEHNRPIDDGFVGVGPRIAASPAGGRQIKVHAQTQPVQGITRTTTRVAWNATSGHWVVVQHFPSTTGWEQATQTYAESEQPNYTVSDGRRP